MGGKEEFLSIDRRRVLAIGAMGAAALAPAFRVVSGQTGGDGKETAPAGSPSETLRGHTQSLADAVSSGDAAVWQTLLHDDCVYTSEDGEVFDKKKMVEQVKPLPEGVSGVLKIVEFRARVTGGTAVATYVSDENEIYHGHKLHCQYRSTDTWRKTGAGWRLLSSQVLALRMDPPAIAIPPEKLAGYCGTYALAPGVALEIRRTGGGLEGQQTGRAARELRVEAPDVLFSPGRPRIRYVFRRDGSGAITGFAERREAWDLDWTRIGAPRTG